MHNETKNPRYFLKPLLKGTVPKKTEFNFMLYILRTKLFYVKQLLGQQHFVLLRVHKFFVTMEKT